MDKLHTPSRQKTKMLGWTRSLPDVRDHVYSASLRTLTSLPDSVALPFDFPVYNQGHIGSCTANALAAAVQFDREKNGQEPPFIPSRLFIYYNERVIEGDPGMDGGAQIRNGIKTLNQNGVCPEDDWPYVPTEAESEGGPFPIGSAPATAPPQQCYDEAQTYKISNYQALTQSLNQLQGCLAEGFPFVFGFTVYSSWYGTNPPATTIPLPSNNDSVVGGHAVLCVGYDNATNLFKIRNSWGEALGEDGYFYIPYAYVLNENLASDFWVINTITD